MLIGRLWGWRVGGEEKVLGVLMAERHLVVVVVVEGRWGKASERRARSAVADGACGGIVGA